MEVKSERKSNLQNYIYGIGQKSVRYEEGRNRQNDLGNTEIRKRNYNEYKDRKQHEKLTKLRIEKLEKERMYERIQRNEAIQSYYQNFFLPNPSHFSSPHFGLTPLGPFTPGLLTPRHSTSQMQGVRFDDSYTILPLFDR